MMKSLWDQMLIIDKSCRACFSSGPSLGDTNTTYLSPFSSRVWPKLSPRADKNIQSLFTFFLCLEISFLTSTTAFLVVLKGRGCFGPGWLML